MVSPEGGDPRTLVESDGREGRPAPVFAGWSSDGTEVYYKASGAEGTASFWAVPVSGGTPRLLVQFDDPSRPSDYPEFSTDGEHFFFTVGTKESDIWLMELFPPR